MQVSLDSLFGTFVYNDTSIVDTCRQVGTLANNRTYYWRVSSRNGDGSSDFSGEWSFTTLPAPETQTITLISSFISPGSRPRGLSWDGECLWIIDNIGHIYKCDTSGNVIKSIPGAYSFDSDLSWDGTGLWIGGASDEGDGALKIDTNGNRIDSLPVHYSDGSGMEWDGQYFWFGDYDLSEIHKYKSNGSEFLNWEADDIAGHPTGIAYDGIRLWIGGSGGTTSNTIYKYSILGDLIYSFDLNDIGITASSGSFSSVAWDGASLWYAADDAFEIYRLRVPYYHEAPSVPVIVSPEDEAEIRNVLTPVLRWNASLDAARYHVQVSEDQVFPTFVVDTTITDTWVQAGPLEDNITYYWHVSAENSGGTSDYSDPYSFTVYDDPPSGPTGLVAIPGNGRVKLCWNPNSEPDINKYRIYRNKTSPANILTDSITGSPPDTFYVDTDVTNDSLYFFRITVVDNAGTESGYSNEAAAVPVIEQGNALLLEGSDDYVDAGTGNALDDLGLEFTVEGWMNYHESVIDHAIFGSVADGEERRISLRSNAFTIQPDGQGYSEVVMDNPVDTGWHHMAGTYDGSNIRLYVDGILQGIQPVSGTLDSSPTFNDIGRQEGSGWYMNGQIDEVCIWSRALSDEEIRNTICRPVQANSPGLVALWHFDEPDTCSTAYDASANMIHGTLMNGASFTRSHAMAPVAPSGLRIYEYLDQSVTLQWNANTDCDLRNYRIYRDTLSPAAVLYDSVYGSPPDTLYTDADVDFDTTYYYRITAVDSLGNEGAFSEQLVLEDIVVDGIKDPFWEKATAHIHLGQDEIVGGEADDENDISADLYLAYDSLYLYGFVEVKDDSVSSKSGCWWNNDAFALRLDPVPDSTVRVDWGSDDEPNWRDIIGNIEFTAETGYDDEMNGTGNTVLSRVLTDNGYIVEFAVPAEDMINNYTDPPETVLLQEGTQIGLYFELADQDEESEREAMLAWGHSSVNINSRKNVTQYGSMTFLSGNQVQLSRDNLVMAEDQPYIQVPHIYSHHWLNENSEGWRYHLYVYANDPQGLDDIDSVWSEGPDGGHYRLYDDGTNGDDWPGGDGRYYLIHDGDFPFPTGEYTFYVKDKSGNISTAIDSLTSNLECPQNLVPAHNSIISEPDFLIDWDEVPGATGYYISVNLASDWEQYWWTWRAPDSTSANYNDNGEGKELIEGEVYILEIGGTDDRNSFRTKVRIAYMIQSSIVIDGIKDAFWDIAAAQIHLGEDELVWGEADDEDDCSADVYLAYDSVYLYGYVEVKDDVIGSNAGWWWNNDAISLKFDTYPDSVIPVSYGSWEEPNGLDILEIDITAEGGISDERNGNECTILSRAQSDSGYVIEFAVSAAGLENSNTNPPEAVLLQEGTQLGFYFEMSDQDEETEKEAVLAWGHASANYNSAYNVTQYGSMTFLSDNQIQLSRDNLVMAEYQPYIQVQNIWILSRIDENLNERWHHHFYVYANDPQGLDDIDSVWVEGPDGSHYRLYDNEENGDGYGGDGLFCSYNLYYYPPAVGVYRFRAVDRAGNEVSVTDTLTGLLDYPEIVIPAGAAIITDPDFLIDWNEVPGASYYSVSINRSSDGDNYWYIEDPDQTSVNYNENGEGRDLVEGEIYYLYINAGNTRNESQTRIKFTYAPQGLVVIDGIRDSFWDTATGQIHLGENEVVWGSIDDESDCSADVYLAYDSLFLYGLIEVADDTMGAEYDWWWDNDAFALRFDTDPATLATEQDASDILSLEFTARSDADDRRNGGDEYDDNAYVLLSRNINDQGYILEFAVSAAGLINRSPDPDETLALKEGTQAGFLFQMADEDSIQGREAELAWGHYSANVNSADNVAQYGSITLLADNQIQLSHDNLVMDEYNPFIQIDGFSLSHSCEENQSEYWDLYFSVYVNDPQGLDDIDSVWAEDPEGSCYILNDNNEDCDDYAGDGRYYYCGGSDTPFTTGEYHLYVVDNTGNVNSLEDTFPELLDCPGNMLPASNSIITDPDFSIKWDKVPGAEKYWVDIASIESGGDNWFWHSGWIDTGQTSVTYNGEELEFGKKYRIQVSAGYGNTYSNTRASFAFRESNRRTIYINHLNTTGIEYGTRDFPFSTIQEGIDATIPGDTVLVYPGTYVENVNINDAGGLVLGSLFLVTGDTGFVARTIIDGNWNGPVLYAWRFTDTLEISGFTITNGQGENGGGVSIRDSAHIRMRHLDIINNTANTNGAGIYISKGSLELSESRLIDNYSPNGGSAIRAIETGLSVSNTVIAKNRGFRSLELSYVQGSILNSTIADNPDGAFHFHDSDVEIRNCIEWNNNKDNWYDSPPDIQYSLIEGGASGAGIMDADPMFTDADAGDYRLQVSSPCINLGTPDTTGLNIPSTDLAGNPRIFDGRIDMGAYEFNEDLTAMILYTDTAVTIDGEITESIWDRSDKYHINKTFTGETFDDQDDLSAYWKAVWDEDGVYILVEVTADDTLLTDGTYGEHYQQDLIEIYIDMNTDNLADGAGPSEGIYMGNPTNGHYVFVYRRGSEFATPEDWQTGCEIAITEDQEDATSVQELFVPWSLITDEEGNVFTPDENVSIGFDVCIADNDGPDNGDARNRKVWVNDGTYGYDAWINMDHCGKMRMFRESEEGLDVTVTAGRSSVCPGEEVQLNAVPEGETGSCSYNWTSDPPGPAYAFSDPVVSPEVTTTYYVEVTDQENSVTDSVTITVLSLPAVDAGPDISIPYNTSVTLKGTASGGSGFYSYEWSPADSFDYSFIKNPSTCRLRGSNLFTLSATDYGSGCRNTDQVLVTVTGSTLDAGISVSRDTVCPGETVRLLAMPTGGTGDYSYTWTSDPEGFTSSLAGPSDTPAGNITYYLVADDGTSSDSASREIVVYMTAEPESPDVSVCYGDEVLPLTALGNEITWYDDNTLSTIIGMDDTLQTGMSSIGEYSCYVTQTNKNCVSPAAEVVLKIIELPEVTVNLTDTVMEEGGTVRLTASGAEGYSWAPSDGLDKTTGDTVLASPDENTVYTVTGSNGICSNDVKISVYILCDACDGEQVIFDQDGEINYCSTNRVYPGNDDCSWLVYPNGVTSVYLLFDTIDIMPGDYIRVYDGFYVNSQLLGEFDNDHLPTGQIQSGSMLYILFHSDESGTGLGFRARYRSGQPVGIGGSKIISGLSIYPNPVTGLLNIEFISREETELTINVFNTLLQLLKNKNIHAMAGRNHEVLDMYGFGPGIYYLQISSGSVNTVRKVIVR